MMEKESQFYAVETSSADGSDSRRGRGPFAPSEAILKRR